MLRKILIGMFVFCAAFAVFAESDVKLSADGKEVVCGNKKLLLKQDGSIIVANAAGQIAKITLSNAFINKKTGETEWGFHSPSICKMSVEEGTVKWYIAKWRGNESFKVAEQTLEVMPDGLVKLSVEFENIDNEEIKFRNRGALFVLVPIAGNEGRKVIYNDKTLTVSEKITSQDWRSEEYKYTIFSDVPDAAFSISAKKPEVKDTTLYRVGKEIRFTYVFPAEGPCVTSIDLRAKNN